MSGGDSTRSELKAILLFVSILVILYGFVEFSEIFTPEFCAIFKSLPALYCAFRAFNCWKQTTNKQKIRHNIAFQYCFTIITGLIFCAGGDFFLRLDKAGYKIEPSFFILGLLSFLIGHIFFIIAFWLDGGNGLQLKWGVLIYLYVAIYLFYILKRIPQEDNILRTGVTTYCIIIGTMCHRSLSLSFDAYPRVQSTKFATYGSIFFVISDSLLAYNRFINPIPFDYVWVLGTYFLALVFLASSCDGSSRWAAGWQ